jgi:hypothetical protein
MVMAQAETLSEMASELYRGRNNVFLVRALANTRFQ